MKKNKIIFWITTGFLFLFEGLMPLSTLVFAPQYMTAGTKPLGYPDYFADAEESIRYNRQDGFSRCLTESMYYSDKKNQSYLT